MVTTGDFQYYVHKSFHYFLQKLSKFANVTIWHQSGNIHSILKQIKTTPDFIFINEFGETNSPHITGLSTLTIPFGVYLHDIHYQIEKRKQQLHQANPKYIFSYYRDRFVEFFPEFVDRMIWLPHHVNTHVFKDYHEKKSIDFLLVGSIHPRVYPLRTKILKTMRSIHGFRYHPHPGYRNFHPNENALIGQRYAREINRAKIFMTCDSKYHYPLNKYYEVLACKTLLLAPTSKELEDLGFIPHRHFVPISEHDFQRKALYYLRHDVIREKIAAEGYRMIRAKHSTEQRINQFLTIVNQIIQKERSERLEGNATK